MNAEGDTFEQALADAMKCVAFVEVCIAEIADEKINTPDTATSATKKGTVRSRMRK